MIARRRRKIFGGIIVFYMDLYDMFVRFGGVFNAILKDLYSKMRYKIQNFRLKMFFLSCFVLKNVFCQGGGGVPLR